MAREHTLHAHDGRKAQTAMFVREGEVGSRSASLAKARRVRAVPRKLNMPVDRQSLVGKTEAVEQEYRGILAIVVAHQRRRVVAVFDSEMSVQRALWPSAGMVLGLLHLVPPRLTVEIAWMTIVSYRRTLRHFLDWIEELVVQILHRTKRSQSDCMEVVVRSNGVREEDSVRRSCYSDLA